MADSVVLGWPKGFGHRESDGSLTINDNTLNSHLKVCFVASAHAAGKQEHHQQCLLVIEPVHSTNRDSL